MPMFIKEKDGTQLPGLSFSNTETPVLNMEGDFSLKSVPMSMDVNPIFDSTCVIIKKDDGISGLYTKGLTDCQALTMIERDDHGAITKIAMHHFWGGLSEDNIEQFISYCRNKGFNDNLELVHNPGITFNPENYSGKKIVDYLNKSGITNQNNIQRIYHADPCADCCVMFNGQIGNASFAPDILSSKSVVHQLDSLDVAKSNFQGLINRYEKEKGPEKSQQLVELRNTILADKLLNNPAMFLEKTRKFIVTAESSPDNLKQKLYEKYREEVQKQPCLSTFTRNACVALAATIIGIIPAVIIASRYKSAVKEVREAQLKTVEDCLNVSSPSMR
ncbi:hypothetical protein Lsai_0264 [Legionella sainthelensi]|uniref:Uncharacterized protein n=1 Tax=Legionella sainthelensi TaxID=28087 RepID=A0A0W0YTI3_9GAMM|nr:hypothetical protein [Legionella sainthelensi]KTD60154.1 hypothetical protein Lsai_0264 [Legionella sainthelensi]VEH32552.1 Uncharacterised protein [Legionella sainthelensi]